MRALRQRGPALGQPSNPKAARLWRSELPALPVALAANGQLDKLLLSCYPMHAWVA